MLQVKFFCTSSQNISKHCCHYWSCSLFTQCPLKRLRVSATISADCPFKSFVLEIQSSWVWRSTATRPTSNWVQSKNFTHTLTNMVLGNASASKIWQHFYLWLVCIWFSCTATRWQPWRLVFLKGAIYRSRHHLKVAAGKPQQCEHKSKRSGSKHWFIQDVTQGSKGTYHLSATI